MADSHTMWRLRPELGPSCPRCHIRMDVREHRWNGYKPGRTRKHERWFVCQNTGCVQDVVLEPQYLMGGAAAP